MHIYWTEQHETGHSDLQVTMTLIMTHMFTEFHHITFSFQNDF